MSICTISGSHFENDKQEESLERPIKLEKLNSSVSYAYSFIWMQREFLQCRSGYYPNGTATYNLSIIKLELSGDVHPLPGPTTTKCPVWAKTVSNWRYKYVCNDCKQISRAKCTRLELNRNTRNTKCQA